MKARKEQLPVSKTDGGDDAVASQNLCHALRLNFNQPRKEKKGKEDAWILSEPWQLSVFIDRGAFIKKIPTFSVAGQMRCFQKPGVRHYRRFQFQSQIQQHRGVRSAELRGPAQQFGDGSSLDIGLQTGGEDAPDEGFHCLVDSSEERGRRRRPNGMDERKRRRKEEGKEKRRDEKRSKEGTQRHTGDAQRHAYNTRAFPPFPLCSAVPCAVALFPLDAPRGAK